MIKRQRDFLEYLNKLEGIIADANLENSKIENLKKQITETELLVPVVGAFSAGKSSIINSFLKDDILPVGITPETALATELRASQSNYIEAVKQDDISDRYKITQMEEIKNKAKNYKYLKLFLNNESLKKIEPLIIVDMPGFDSPLELHNQAILNYLNRGVFFIVVNSVEDGCLQRSIIRELHNIVEFGKGFCFCLSKINLRSASEVEEVKKRIEEQLKDEFEFNDNIELLDDSAGENLNKLLSQIDVDKLFEKIFIDNLKSLYFQIESNINVKIATLSNSKEDAHNAINELKETLNKIIKKKEEMITDVKNRYSNVAVEHIITSVANEIIANQENLLQLAIHNPDAFSRELNEIIKSRLIIEIKDKLDEISDDILKEFHLELSNLSSNLSNFSLDAEWCKKLTDSTKIIIESIQNRLGKFSETLSGKRGQIYKVVATILGLTTNILNPILEIALFFLPDLISLFTSKYNENKQKDVIMQKLQSEIIPSLKVKLRSKLPEIFNEQLNKLITSISEQFEHELRTKGQEIKKSMEEKESTISNIDDEISKLIKIRDMAQNLTTKILY